MRVGVGVVIDVGDYLAACFLPTGIACAAQAAVLGADQPDIVFADNIGCIVRRTIVDNDDLIVRIIERR